MRCFRYGGGGVTCKSSIDKIKDYVKQNIFKGNSSQFVKGDSSLDSTEYVVNVKGKQLSTEDFTTLLKQKLEQLAIDVPDIDAKLTALKTSLDTILDLDNATTVIDTFQEIENFLQGVTNTQTLTGLLQEMKSEIVALIPTNVVKFYNINNVETDIDTITAPGHYRLGGAKSLNVPANEYLYGQLLVIRGGGDSIAQMLFSYQKVPILVRAGNPVVVNGIGNWTPWRKLVEASGTSSQFLKADGSVDGTAYLPLTGGTLTGQLLIATSFDGKLILNNTDDEAARNYIIFQQKGTTINTLGIRGVNGELRWGTDAIWHAGNDGSGSGLDADLLDGLQSTAFFQNVTAQYTNNIDNISNAGKYRLAPATTGVPEEVSPNGCMLCHYTFDSNSARQVLYNYFGSNAIYTRRKYNAVWQEWSTIALTTSNVASADKLTTKRLTNEDLNDVKTDGAIYYADGNNSCSNKPLTSSIGFNLQVLKVADGQYVQIFTVWSSGNMYKRAFNTSTWSAWKKMLTEDDIASLVSRIEALESK